MKNVWRLREQVNRQVQGSASAAHVPESAGCTGGQPFTSFTKFKDAKRKHQRHDSDLDERFRAGAVTSHDIGWEKRGDIPAGAGATSGRQRFAVQESDFTKYYHDLMSTLQPRTLLESRDLPLARRFGR